MAKRSPDWLVPYDEDGNVINDVSAGPVVAKWRENTPFFARMRVMGHTVNGSKRSTFWLADDDGKATYPMGPRDFMELVCYTRIDEGLTERLRWRFRKSGTRFSVAVVWK